MKNKKLQAFIFASLLIEFFCILACQPSVEAVGLISLSPSQATVGSNISIIGTTTNLNQPYTIWFDINGNGNPFESGEMIRNGTSMNYTVSTFFVVPDCAGSDTGSPHFVALRDFNNGPYAIFDNFPVLTSRSLTTPSNLFAGSNVAITIVVKGGGALQPRTFGVRVTRPDGTISMWYNFTQSTNTVGSLSRTINYPTDFSSSATVLGSYSIQVYETTPAPAHTFGGSFSVGANDPPVATITSINPNPALVGQQISFVGTGSDKNGPINAYRWTSNITGQLSTSPSFNASLAAGTHLISLYVQDTGGLWSTPSTRVVNVTQPSNLAAIIDSIIVDSSVSPAQVTFSGHGIDSQWPITSYQWETVINGVTTTLNTASKFTTSSLPVGVYTIAFRVRNSQGVWSNATSQPLTVPQGNLVGGDLMAVIDSVSPNPSVLGQRITFVGHGAVTNGAITSYQWSSSIDGFLSSSDSFSTSSLSEGTHLISFTVQNSSNSWSSPAIITITISSNLAPTANVDNSKTPAKIGEGQTVSFSGFGNDDDGVVVAYSWDSDIDGHLSDSSDFSTSSLSSGTHTISFRVQDNAGAWSETVTFLLIVEIFSPTGGELDIAAFTLTTTFVFTAIIGTTYYFYSLPSSVRFNSKFRKKLKKEKKRQEKEKKKREKKRQDGKPHLELEASAPLAVFGPLHDATQLNVKNTGSVEAKEVVLISSTDNGVTLTEDPPHKFNLAAGEAKPFVWQFDLDDKSNRGIYRLFFRANCTQDTSPDVICLFRSFKIGLLSTPSTTALAEPLRAWLQEKGYNYTELQSADDLRGTLHQYDLIILAPEIDLADKWVRNLSSYVKNSQSLIVIDQIIPGEEPASAQRMAELLGYETLKFEPFEYGSGQLKILTDPLVKNLGFVSTDEVEIQKCCGNRCVSDLSTAKPLTKFTSQNKHSEFTAIFANTYGKGRVLHLNFHAEQATDQINDILEKSIHWLLCTDDLNERKQT